MAKEITNSVSKNIIGVTKRAVKRKQKSQKKKGKEFKFDEYGPGVVPERVWEGYKV